jgi:hypothetical protein
MSGRALQGAEDSSVCSACEQVASKELEERAL